MKSKILVVFFLLLILTGCQLITSSTPPGEGTLLYAPVDKDGEFTGELILSDVSGKILDKFTIPEDGEVDFISFIYPIRAPGIAVVRVDYAEKRKVYWLDTTSGEMQTLELGDANLYTGVSFNNTHYAIFNQYVSEESRFDIFLLDLFSGKLTDINALFGEDEKFYSWILSPDESFLILRGETHYILPTSNPQEARQIQADGTINYIFFSNDSNHFLVSIRGDTENQVVTQSVDGSESEVLYTAPGDYIQAAFINDEEILMLMGGKTIVFDLTTGEEQVLFENGGIISSIFHLPENEGVFVNLMADSSETDDLTYGFVYINTATDELKTYPELVDMWVIGAGWNTNPHWVYFADDPINLTTLQAIDLSNGEVVDLINLDAPTSTFLFYGHFSQDSATSSAYYYDSEYTEKFIAINAEEGKTYDLVETEKFRGNGGTDLENYLLAYVVASEKDPQPMIMLLDLQNGKTYEFRPGRSPIWVMP
jgi:hypothetical protein